ncbi:MAG: glycosyltransferase family 2 protein [Firmicutes bacterium]|nr:glycosyltransferase family 2 protein [Bacillota bacterium]
MTADLSPLVSIIIPTWNRRVLLGECLAAIAADPYPNKEVIVINDAGEDVSPVTGRFRDLLNVRLLSLSANGGHVKARNLGVRCARGQLIMPCDDDDIVLPGHIAELVAVWRARGGLVRADAEVVRYAPALAERAPAARRVLTRTDFAFATDLALLRRWNYVIPSGILYERALHDSIGPFDETLGHHWDWDFLLRATAQVPLRRVCQASVLYFVSAAGDNQSAHPQRMIGSVQRLCDKHGLGQLPVSSFAAMLEVEEVRRARRPTTRMWDGSFRFLQSCAAEPGDIGAS